MTNNDKILKNINQNHNILRIHLRVKLINIINVDSES